jgi:hypothetical protein
MSLVRCFHKSSAMELVDFALHLIIRTILPQFRCFHKSSAIELVDFALHLIIRTI